MATTVTLNLIAAVVVAVFGRRDPDRNSAGIQYRRVTPG